MKQCCLIGMYIGKCMKIRTAAKQAIICTYFSNRTEKKGCHLHQGQELVNIPQVAVCPT